MTTREAVQLVLHASALGARGKGGEIFVLDMGDPVLIKDLANQMIRLAGLTPGKDIDVQFTGLRAGEKLREELFHKNEPLCQTSVTGLQQATPRPSDLSILKNQIKSLCEATNGENKNIIISKMKEIIPEFDDSSRCTDNKINKDENRRKY